MKIKRLIPLVVVILGIAAGSFFARSVDIRGDGMEYLLMSKAFMQHGSPAITIDDIASLNHSSANKYTNVYAFTRGREPQTLGGFFRSHSGAFYSYHFFLYSLFNVPALLVIETLKLPSAFSFAVTNSCFAALACMTVFSLRIPLIKRVTLVVLFLTSGTLYYLPWSHPEVFSASLLMIGICFAYRRDYRFAAVITAVASTQNPPIAFITAAYLCWDFYTNLRDSRKLLPSSSGIALWAGAVLITVLPSLFYYLNFSTPNLIAARGFSDPKLISLARLASVYFDLNQGAIIAVPTLLALPIFVALRLRDNVFRRELIFACILVLLSVIIAIPSLSTINWCSGFTVIMRYAYWISIPLLFSLVLLMPAARICHRITLGLMMVTQIAVCYARGGVNAVKHPARFTPLATYVATAFPSLYNPIPEIFIEFAQGYEGVPTGGVFFISSRHSVVKVLYHRAYAADLWPYLITQDRLLANISSVHPSEGGWVYANLAHPVETNLPDGLYAHTQPLLLEPAVRYAPSESRLFYHGWSVDEGTHRWSVTNESFLRFKLPEHLAPQSLLVIEGRFYQPQEVTIKVNGEAAPGVIVDQDRIAIPITPVFNSEKEIILSFHWSEIFIPSRTDNRTIAFSVTGIILHGSTQP